MADPHAVYGLDITSMLFGGVVSTVFMYPLLEYFRGSSSSQGGEDGSYSGGSAEVPNSQYLDPVSVELERQAQLEAQQQHERHLLSSSSSDNQRILFNANQLQLTMAEAFAVSLVVGLAVAAFLSTLPFHMLIARAWGKVGSQQQKSENSSRNSTSGTIDATVSTVSQHDLSLDGEEQQEEENDEENEYDENDEELLQRKSERRRGVVHPQHHDSHHRHHDDEEEERYDLRSHSRISVAAEPHSHHQQQHAAGIPVDAVGKKQQRRSAGGTKQHMERDYGAGAAGDVANAVSTTGFEN